jgi:hypothetical protein
MPAIKVKGINIADTIVRVFMISFSSYVFERRKEIRSALEHSHV